MKIGVRVKMNVSQIDKARLFKGTKGVYLDATVFIDVDQKDQYDNNGMITQDITKEEKEQGVQGNILGNVQVFWSDIPSPIGQSQGQQAPRQQQGGGFQQQQAKPQQNFEQGFAGQQQGAKVNPQAPTEIPYDDDIPFN